MESYGAWTPRSARRRARLLDRYRSTEGMCAIDLDVEEAADVASGAPEPGPHAGWQWRPVAGPRLVWSGP